MILLPEQPRVPGTPIRGLGEGGGAPYFWGEVPGTPFPGTPHRQGSTHRRRCTHKAEHTKRGFWPPQESCYLRGRRQGGTHRRRCTHKVVHRKGGLWLPQESCYLRGGAGVGPRVERSKPKVGGGGQGGVVGGGGSGGVGCYGFEQQQRSSAQVASRSCNRTAVCE